MNTQDRARAMRAEGQTFAQIATRLGIHKSYAYRCAGDVTPAEARVKPSARSIVRYFARNGGCSTLSGMVPISLPRIECLHGRVAEGRVAEGRVAA